MTTINARLFRPTYFALNPENQEDIPNPLLKAFKKVDKQIESGVNGIKCLLIIRKWNRT